MKTEDFDPDDLSKFRRSRGLLEADIDMVCRLWLRGEAKLAEGQFMTPHFIGKLLMQVDSLDKQPSVGSVNQVLKKWERKEYCICRVNPYAFVKFTQEGLTQGLENFNWKHNYKKVVTE